MPQPYKMKTFKKKTQNLIKTYFPGIRDMSQTNRGKNQILKNVPKPNENGLQKKNHETDVFRTPRKFITMIRAQFFGRNLVVLLVLAGDTPFDMFFAKICMRL